MPRTFAQFVQRIRRLRTSVITVLFRFLARSQSTDDRFSVALDRFAEATRTGDRTAAEGAMLDALSIASERFDEQSPDPIEEEIERCYEQHDYSSLEAIRLKQIADLEMRGETSLGLHIKLCELYSVLNRTQEALQQAAMALVAAREVDSPFVVAMTLRSQGILNLRVGHVDDARRCGDEALLALDPHDRLYDQMRASLMVLLARCAVDADSVDDAESYLDRAIELLHPYEAPDFAAGLHGDIAAWLAVTARLRQKREDVDGALSAWSDSVDRSRRINAMPHCAGMHTALDLARKLRHYGDALRTAGNHSDADGAEAESATIIRDLGLPPQEYY